MSYETLGASAIDQVIVIRLKDSVAIARDNSAIARTISLVPGVPDHWIKTAADALVIPSVVDEIKKTLKNRKPPIEAEVAIVDGSFLAGRPLPAIEPVKQTPMWRTVVAVFAILGLGAVFVASELRTPKAKAF